MECHTERLATRSKRTVCDANGRGLERPNERMMTDFADCKRVEQVPVLEDRI